MNLKLKLMLLTLSVFIVSLVSIGTIVFIKSQGADEKFDPHVLLKKINPQDNLPDFLEIENIVKEAMQKYGTRAGFEVIDAGEEMGIINNDACHGLLHYVGHEAYAKFPYDYEALLGVVEGTDCIGGYLHGIEAEIVLASGNVIEDVQNFCVFQKEKGVNPGACYHGVGHATTELYDYDVHKSLALCDALKGAPESDLTNCYRGVFSEVGNVATGYDGHTGLFTDKRDIADLDPEKPFIYCEHFEEQYQSSCKSQILKVAQQDMDMEEWLSICTDEAYKESTRNICTNISVGVYVRHHLSFSDNTTVPTQFKLLPVEQQKIGILGAAEAFSGYFADGVNKDWQSFCASVEDKTVYSYCNDVFTRMIKYGEAPWMERSDIR